MYLIQEWIYRGYPMPVEKHEKWTEDDNDANSIYEKMGQHLNVTAACEPIYPSFVRMFKMKQSALTENMWGVDKCLRMTEAMGESN